MLHEKTWQAVEIWKTITEKGIPFVPETLFFRRTTYNDCPPGSVLQIASTDMMFDIVHFAL